MRTECKLAELFGLHVHDPYVSRLGRAGNYQRQLRSVLGKSAVAHQLARQLRARYLLVLDKVVKRKLASPFHIPQQRSHRALLIETDSIQLTILALCQDFDFPRRSVCGKFDSAERKQIAVFVRGDISCASIRSYLSREERNAFMLSNERVLACGHIEQIKIVVATAAQPGQQRAFAVA